MKINMNEETKTKKSIWKRWWFWLIVVFIIIIIAASSGGEKKTTKPEQQSSQEQTQIQEGSQASTEKQKAAWQEVKSWSGSGIKNTEPFEITGDQWRINWTNPTQNEVLQIMVYKVGNEIVDTVAVNTMDKGNDSSYVYKKGSFYLSINATGNWQIEVEEYK